MDIFDSFLLTNYDEKGVAVSHKWGNDRKMSTAIIGAAYYIRQHCEGCGMFRWKLMKSDGSQFETRPNHRGWEYFDENGEYEGPLTEPPDCREWAMRKALK